MKCLVIRFSSLGDIVLTAPVVESLAAGQPDTQIHYATSARFQSLVDHFPTDTVVHPFAGGSRKEFLAYADSLSEENFDFVFDLHANWRSQMLRRRIDAASVYRYPRDFLPRWGMVYLKRGFAKARPVVDRYLTTLAAAGIPTITDVPRLEIDKAKKQAAADKLAPQGWTADRPTVGIGWGASWPTKKVPPEFWDGMLGRLKQPINPAYLILANADDETEVTEFAGRHGAEDVFSFCGQELDLALGAVSLCQAFVTSDSGLMHAAAALGVPTFGIFGPTHPALGFAPRGSGSQAIHSGIFCSPCSRHGKVACYRKHRYCFDKIDTHSLAQQISYIIAEAKPDDQ